MIAVNCYQHPKNDQERIFYKFLSLGYIRPILSQSKCYCSLTFADLRGIFPLNPHQCFALDPLRRGGGLTTPPASPAETDVPKILLQRLSEFFLFALNTSSGDLNFWKKCSFGSKRLVLSKNYQ